MSKIDLRNIERVPGRCGGKPVIGGTRIRVSGILISYRHGMSVEEIVQQFPSLRPADVHDALAYAYDHLDEMEAERLEDEQAEMDAKARFGRGAPRQ
jgi:uncharacterized protein (DUF433 family)